jgi:hypothetical protein
MPRILALDLARGFTVLIMPSVHVVMLYSQPSVQQSLLGVVLQFLAEGPGAQLFMLIMGATFAFSEKYVSAQKVFKRTIYLILGAYALNVLKFVIPLELDILPAALISDLGSSTLDLFFLGDIFHFAAIVYPVLYFVKRTHHYPGVAILFAFAIMLLSPLVWDVKTGIIFVDQVLIYLTGGPPHCFFPVFPWLVYPLVGLAMGQCLISRKLTLLGTLIIVFSLLLPSTTEYNSFYRTLPADTLFHLGIVLLWLSVINWISRKVKINFLFQFLSFCSRNITLIYVIQWVLIFWFVPLLGYHQLDFMPTLLWMGIVSILTLTLTKLLQHASTKKSI